jgi:hypothetical protein
LAWSLPRDQAQLSCPGDGLGAVGRAELAQDVADVLLDGIEGDHELARDGLVRPAGRQHHRAGAVAKDSTRMGTFG